MKKQYVCRYDSAIVNNPPQAAKPAHDVDDAPHDYWNRTKIQEQLSKLSLTQHEYYVLEPI